MERSLSALVAVRNVESTLRGTVLGILDVLPELTRRFELLVIDDCSSDATIEVADELAAVFPQVFVARHPIPRGHAAALVTGLDRSAGQIVFFADEDCRLALDPLRQLWMALEGYELVFGCPGNREGWPSTDSSIPLHGGGYQMGYRRVLRELAHALGSRQTLIDELTRGRIPWRKLEIHTELAGMRRFSPPAARAVPGTAATLADRSIRTDRPTAEPAGPKHASYSFRPAETVYEP